MVIGVSKLLFGIKVVIINILLGLFLYLMARPSVERFIEGGVMVDVTTIPKTLNGRPQFDKVPPPTVTLCPRMNVSGGWKLQEAPGNKTAWIAESCNFRDMEDILKCINETTFSFNETITYAIHNLKTKNDVKDLALWNSSLATVYFGYCYSFTLAEKLQADMVTDALVFGLNTDLSYRVFLHDPDYHHFVSNPLVFPRLWREYGAKVMQRGSFEWLYISLTQHQKMNRADQPCETAEDYNFLGCVKTSQAREVGCRPAWDRWSPRDIPVCTNIQQLQRHEEMDWANFNYEQKIIINNTECLPPCKYKEYKLVGEPQYGFVDNLLGNTSTKVEFALGLNFVSTDIRFEKEVEIYPLLSFISELGGSLGLFLGFSFLTIWDFIDYLILRYDSIKLFY